MVGLFFYLIFVLTKQNNMQHKKIYVTVELTIESDNEITNDTLDRVAQEMDYNFSYDEDGVKIMPNLTQIIETSETLNQ